VSEYTFRGTPADVDDPPYRKPDGHLMLDSVRSILSSGRPDEAISGELAELLGFDELELVSDILNNRSQFFEESRAVNEPILTPLPSKGKRNEIRNSSSATTKGTPHVSYPRSLAPDQVRRRMEEQLQANASRPLFTGTAVSRVVSSHYGASHVKSGGSSMNNQRSCLMCTLLTQTWVAVLCFLSLGVSICYRLEPSEKRRR